MLTLLRINLLAYILLIANSMMTIRFISVTQSMGQGQGNFERSSLIFKFVEFIFLVLCYDIWSCSEINIKQTL